MTRSFRIMEITGPDGQGILHTHYHFYVSFEYDPGEPYKTEQGRVVVRLTDGLAHALAGGHVEHEANTGRAIARIRFFVNKKLGEILAMPMPDLNQFFALKVEDIDELLRIDEKRVRENNDWIAVQDGTKRERKKVFISCGQRTAEEKELGAKIAKLVYDEAGLEGYFAEYQTSLEGLTANIFNALYNAAGFIAIMHRRDPFSSTPEAFRGSVWVEQEIAIAAFLVQSLGISLPSKVYIQSGVMREGVRGYIILNPIEFTSHEDVIEDLKNWLPALKMVGV